MIKCLLGGRLFTQGELRWQSRFDPSLPTSFYFPSSAARLSQCQANIFLGYEQTKKSTCDLIAEGQVSSGLVALSMHAPLALRYSMCFHFLPLYKTEAKTIPCWIAAMMAVRPRHQHSTGGSPSKPETVKLDLHQAYLKAFGIRILRTASRYRRVSALNAAHWGRGSNVEAQDYFIHQAEQFSLLAPRLKDVSHLPSSHIMAMAARTMRSRSCRPSVPTAMRELAMEVGNSIALTVMI